MYLTKIDSIDDTYNISYINADDTTIMCGSATINSSLCIGGICNHMFDIQSSSSCPNDANITVTAEDSSFIENPGKIRIGTLQSSFLIYVLSWC